MQPKRSRNKNKNQNNHELESQTTRRQRKKARRRERKQKRKIRRRIFPIWLRILFIIVGCIGAIIAGVMVGYGVLGDGVPQDALKKETWQHIIDIVTRKE